MSRVSRDFLIDSQQNRAQLRLLYLFYNKELSSPSTTFYFQNKV